MTVSSIVVIAEIKGFAKLSTELARGMDAVAVTPERVRASAIQIINETAKASSLTNTPTHSAHIGGDTWFFQFADIITAAWFVCSFLHRCRRLVTETGLFFIKPSIALALGEPKLSDGRFLDDESIGAYRLADGGKPFCFYVHANAVSSMSGAPWLKLEGSISSEQERPEAILGKWQEVIPADISAEEDFKISLPTLLLDSEVIYSRTASEAIGNIVRQQANSASVCAFGGPVPLDVPFYKSYLRETILALKRDSGPSFSVLSYIPHNEPATSYAWVELCRRLSIQHSARFAFSAFTIPEGQLRPFSFQIFDQGTVHLGLRSYSMQTGTPTMSSAIMIRNRNIAERFYGEFVENYRKVGVLSDKAAGEIVGSLIGLSPALKRDAMERAESMLRET
jgi:hypothetical protein